MAWAIVLSLLLGGAIPLLYIRATPTPSGQLWLFNWAIAAAAGVAYGVVAGRGHRRLYHLMAWLFVYLFLGLAPLVQLRRGLEPSTTPGALSRLQPDTAMVVIVGVVAFIVGGTIWKTKERSVKEAARPLDHHYVYAAAGVSLLFSLYYIARVTPAALFDNRGELVAHQFAAWPDPTMSALFIAAGTMSPLVVVAALRRLRRTHATTANGALMWLMVALLCISVNFISSPRYVFGTVGLSLVAIAGGFDGRNRLRCGALLVVAGMLFVFPYADRFRTAETPKYSKGGPTSTLISGDFDAFAQIQNAVEYESEHGSTRGRQALGVVLFWVPRGMWPDKPLDTGVLIAKDRGYHFTNLSAPLWAELIINGGWLALVTGMAGFGWIVRRLDNAQVVAGDHQAILSNILPFYMLILLRGSLLQSVLRLAVLVAITHLVLRKREKSPK